VNRPPCAGIGVAEHAAPGGISPWAVVSADSAGLRGLATGVPHPPTGGVAPRNAHPRSAILRSVRKIRVVVSLIEADFRAGKGTVGGAYSQDANQTPNPAIGGHSRGYNPIGLSE
jgi:hypothetical protein